MNKACPFCNKDKIKVEMKTGKKGYEGGYRYTQLIASVRCNCCFARGPSTSAKYYGYMYSEESQKIIRELENKALNLWNSRQY